MSKRISKGMFVALRERLMAMMDTAAHRARLREAQWDSWHAGVAARRQGLTTTRCPYQPGHELREAWLSGWRAENAALKAQPAAGRRAAA